ncbi:MAG: peptidylprolyl isomerase [Armatimonadota bacterium]|nr:peptidylprolyl isomerase [Armatimonadota bacterium]
MVTIETEKGTIKAKLYDEKAPITAGNFILLAEKGFYDGLTFHRVEPGFVIQGGDPNGDGTGGPGFSIPLETSPELRHHRGTLSMARSMDPDSAGSQFFVCLAREAAKHLDDEYAAFGKVTEGMDVVDQIQVGDQITKVTVTSESPHAKKAREAAREARVPDSE